MMECKSVEDELLGSVGKDIGQWEDEFGECVDAFVCREGEFGRRIECVFGRV
jgi:hypothetical protein